MPRLGSSAHLSVVKILDFGAYLDAEHLGEVLLPRKFCPPQLQIGDQLDVFLYLDSEDRLVATTQTPYAEVGKFAWLRVNDTTPVGAFLDWGLDKDLLLPFAEQTRQAQIGQRYLVYLYIDRLNSRNRSIGKNRALFE